MFSESVKIIRILAFGAFTLSIFSIGWEIASNYNQRVAEEQYRLSAIANGEPSFRIYGDYGDQRKLKRLILVPFTFIAFLCIRRSSFVSLAFYGLSIGLYLIWLRNVYDVVTIDWNLYSDRSPFAIALLAANPFDYALFATILIISPCMLGSFFGNQKDNHNNQSTGEVK